MLKCTFIYLDFSKFFIFIFIILFSPSLAQSWALVVMVMVGQQNCKRDCKRGKGEERMRMRGSLDRQFGSSRWKVLPLLQAQWHPANSNSEPRDREDRGKREGNRESRERELSWRTGIGDGSRVKFALLPDERSTGDGGCFALEQEPARASTRSEAPKERLEWDKLSK